MLKYIHVLKADVDEDPFEDTSKFISDIHTEEWEQFLNGGYTFKEPQAPGTYLVYYKHLVSRNGRPSRRSSSIDSKIGVAVARPAKNNKKRFVWEDPSLRKCIVSRSTYPLPGT